jgi:4-hydroxybenzoate polyprenyltransferase
MTNPYIALLRLDKPVGIWLLLWPCWWGITLASNTGPDVRLLMLFVVGAVIMRAAGCIINDLWDRKIDAEVARTRTRPLASGAIAPWQALWVLAGLLASGAAVLWQLPSTAIVWGLFSLPLVALYPLMKRITWWPQAFLGLTFNWGALVGWAAVRGQVEVPALLLYAGGVLWTLGYDTLYACQDRADDARIGVRSSALRLGGRVLPVVQRFYIVAAVLLGLGALAGGASVWFFAAFGAFFGGFLKYLQGVDISSPAAAMAAFKANVWFGGVVWLALLAGTVYPF